jgi:hypothetical protein
LGVETLRQLMPEEGQLNRQLFLMDQITAEMAGLLELHLEEKFNL